MGGCGSTRWDYHVKKTTVEECLTLSADELTRAGFFELPPGSTFCPWEAAGVMPWIDSLRRLDAALVATYRAELRCLDGKLRRFEQQERIGLTTTEPYFGGVRYWLKCPECQSRRGKLYLPPRHSQYRCRECYDLTYRSAQLQGLEEAQYAKPEARRRRIERLLKRLAQEAEPDAQTGDSRYSGTQLR